MRSFDELNRINMEVNAIALKQKIRNWFEEMELDDEEIEDRIYLANRLYNKFYGILLLIASIIANSEDISEITIFQVSQMAFEEYLEVLEDDEDDEKEEIPKLSNNEDFLKEMKDICDQIIDDTFKNKDTEYYLSADRAFKISVTETNAIKNAQQLNKAIAEGYTKKQWITEKDEKVRDSHKVLDDKIIGINDLFQVGNYLMAYPLDRTYNPGPEEVANCRCVAIYMK